jgi:hypothetical protein
MAWWVSADNGCGTGNTGRGHADVADVGGVRRGHGGRVYNEHDSFSR